MLDKQKWEKEFDERWGWYLQSIIGVAGDITDPNAKAIEFDTEIKQFIASEKQLSKEEARAEFIKVLREVEEVADDEKKKHWCDHCSCLRYAIDLIENPDADRMVYASELSQTNHE